MKTIDPYAETSLRELHRHLVVPLWRRPLLWLRRAGAR